MNKQTLIYIRTSTEEQNPENQLKDCLSIYKEDWGEYEVLKEQQSAWKEDHRREAFNSLLKLIRTKQVKRLLVWDLDRIYRNRKSLLAFFNLCKTYGCVVYSYRQKFLNEMQELNLPPEFTFIKDIMVGNFLQFLGWIAQDESDKKSKRVKAAMRFKDDGTYSYTGKKWGRKRVSTFKMNKLKELYRYKPNTSIREASRELNLSVGVVHKYLQQIKSEQPIISPRS